MTVPRAAERATARRERWPRVLGLAISLASVAGVVWWATRQRAPELPSGAAEIGALTGAVAVYAAATLVRGERWWRLLRRGGARPSRTDSYALTAIGYMGNNVLPARGGDAMRVYLQAPRARTGMREVIGTLLAERLLDAGTLLTLFAVLAYGVLHGIDAPDGTRLVLIVAAIVALAGIAGLVVYVARHHPLIRRMLGFVGPMTMATRELRGVYGLAMVGMTLAIWCLEAATYLAAAGAVGLGISPLEALYLVALASVFVLIPSGPGYAGTLDAAVLFGVRAIGGSGSEAVSYLLALRFVLLVPITGAGLALLVARYGGWSRVRAPRAEASA